MQCSFLEHRQYKVIYRRYASLYFIIGIDIDDDINELSMLEFIHNMVETLDKYFENVCELDVSKMVDSLRDSKPDRQTSHLETSYLSLFSLAVPSLLSVLSPIFEGLPSCEKGCVSH